MPTTPDRFPGTREEDEFRLDPNTSPEGGPGSLSYNGEAFVLQDVLGPFNPRDGGGGLDENQHRLLPQLTHWIDATTYDEVLRVNGKVSSLVTWTSAAKTQKVREALITRDHRGLVAQVVEVQYDSVGTEKERLTEVLSRVGLRISSITRTRA